jgi:chaperonin GroEL (HSP60 family)
MFSAQYQNFKLRFNVTEIRHIHEYQSVITMARVLPYYALQNTASVAGLLMTTEAMVAEKQAMPPEDMY